MYMEIRHLSHTQAFICLPMIMIEPEDMVGDKEYYTVICMTTYCTAWICSLFLDAYPVS